VLPLFDVYLCFFLGGKLLLELDRLLRPGGYFVWSATPVYQKLPEDVEIWEGKFIGALLHSEFRVLGYAIGGILSLDSS
jgi:hypothetical protein